MNNFFNAMKKIIPGKKREEDENLTDVVLTFEVTPMKTSVNLDPYVTGLKIGGTLIDSYESYNRNLDILLSQSISKDSELDYRFRKMNKEGTLQDADNNIPSFEKMRVVGKIGEEKTRLEQSSAYGQLEYQYGDNKIKSIGGFTSIRSNNCVVNGRWCYEIQVLTNGLFQIGWCQLSTPFTSHEGIGDDDSSYAYDGYRNVKWHGNREAYGQIWDIGDIVGCCIDLNIGTIDYYLNGAHLGCAFKNIHSGENKAYFPALSISEGEKCCFNFGMSPLHFSYQGYEPLDIPDAQINGYLEITAQLLDIIKNNTLKILLLDSIPTYHKMLISQKIFNFLAFISFDDPFIFKTLLLPFLYDLASKKPEAFSVFFGYLLSCFDSSHEKKNFFLSFFDTLSNMIEEYSLIGEWGISEWKSLIIIFMEIMKIDTIVEIWIDNKKCIENLRNIFTSNAVRMQEIFEYLQIKKNYTGNVSEMIFEMSGDLYESKKKISQCDGIYTENLAELIKFFLNDKRKFKIKKNGEVMEIFLKSFIDDLIKKGYELTGGMHDVLQFFGHDTMKRDAIIFYKNIFYNLISIFCENYIQLPIETFSCEPWFIRSSQENIFYDEVGVGGTISHVTAEYISQIDDTIKSIPNNPHSEFLSKLIKIAGDTYLQTLRNYLKQLLRFKTVTIQQMVSPIYERGTNEFEKIFRNYFYLFSHSSQLLLYKLSYFIIYWIEELRIRNNQIVYFMPRSLADLPYEIFRFLLKIKSDILKNDQLRHNINASVVHFSKDNFSYLIVRFYTYLFSDSKIANPELRENLILKIKFFLRKKKISKMFEEDDILVEYLIKGLLKYMSIESLSHIACEIICRIIKPNSFGYKGTGHEKSSLMQITKNFFEQNLSTFHEFMDNYSKLINKVMTDYAVSLSEAAEKVLKLGGQGHTMMHDNVESTNSLLKRLLLVYNILCELMKIFEFLLTTYPNEFLDVNTLNYSRFSNFLKNLYSRILEKPYIEYLRQLLDMAKSISEGVSILSMAYSVIGIFLRLYECRDNGKFAEFVEKISNLPDLFMEPFYHLYDLVIGMTGDDNLKPSLEKYKEIVSFFESQRHQKKEHWKMMSAEEWEETNKNESLCILCYSNLANRLLKPCKHSACNECLIQYMSDKDHCFICNAKIEQVEKLELTPKTK